MIRVDTMLAEGLQVGELVLLVDDDEDLSRYAHLAERDNGYAYFELLSLPRGLNWQISSGPALSWSSSPTASSHEETTALGSKGLTLV